jgi:hypothetical protein
MAAIKTAAQLAERALDVAKNYKTLYVMGCIGAPMTKGNKSTYIAHHAYNRQASRREMINAATADTFGFDCVCLIKALLWGWNGNKSKTHGGTVYNSNGVPDINADGMINVCREISTDFSQIEIGEAVWMKGHIGVYVGDGLAVECTPIWKNGVQITACNRTKSGYNRRNWTKHGKLPYVSYTGKGEETGKQQAAISGASLSFKVGDVVQFAGSTHYAHANAANGPACKPGKAKVTAISKGAKHPYHLIAVSGSGSTVYGWVNAADIKGGGEINVGDVVQFSGGPHYVSANSTSYNTCPKAGPAKVTAISKGAKHPYHVVHTNSQSDVYGWVDADKVSK